MTEIQHTTRRLPVTFDQQLALIADRCGGEVVTLPGHRATLTGTPGEVAQVLAIIRNTGRLVSNTLPVPTGVPGQVLVNVRLVPPPQRHVQLVAAPRRLPRWAFWSIVTGVVVLAVGGLAWLVYTVVTAVLSDPFIAAVVVLGVIAIAALVLRGKGRSGGSKTFSGTFTGRIH